MNKKENNLVQKRKKIMLGAFFVLTFISGWVFGHQDAQFSKVGFTPTVLERGTSKSSVDFSVFWRTWEIIEKNYDGKLDYQKMVDGAIKGMVDAIGDPYTNYLSAEDAKQLQDDLSGVVSGIGAEVGIRDNKLIIVAPIEDSPAKNAGLAAGDYIVKINNEITAGMDINAAVAKIRGQEGTKVTLTINRGGQEKNYEITRKKITVKSVKSEIKNKNIGYISVNRFDINTTEEIRAAIVDFKAKGVKKLILDVRDNPGGYLDESVSTSSLFIKEGIIVTEKKRCLVRQEE